MMKVFEGIKMRPASWIKAACYACAIVLIYYSTFKELYSQWSGEEYSYCWVIPFVTLYLIWEKRGLLARIPSSSSWYGLAPLFIGIFLFWVGDLAGEFTALNLSFWFVLVGLAWLHIGWQKMRNIAFAFLVMLAMFPPPAFIYARVTLWSKMISTQLGVWMLHMVGMSVFREGNVIDLGFTKLQVVDACSGLRYIVPLMLMGLLLSHWFKAHIWKRIALFLSSIPIAIFMNSFRIALTGVLFGTFGAQAAEGFYHEFTGWLIFMVALLFFLFEMWALNKMPPKEKREVASQVLPSEDSYGLEVGRDKKIFLQPKFILSMLILLLTIGLSHGIEFRQRVPISKPFGEFPMQVGEWRGSSEAMEQEFRNALNFSDYIIANYKDPQGNSINFYVAYYQDQRKGESIHSPETCFPMNGWAFNDAGETAVSLADGKSLTVNRAVMEKTGVREIAYFWFPQRGRIITKLYQLKIYTFWDALTKHRTDGALVRVLTPVYPSEQLQDAEKRLQSFTKGIVPLLDGYIPGNSLKQ